jgi:hypothetical protein
MKHPVRVCAALAAAAALAGPATPALADGFTLKLSAPADVVVGKPVLIRADGTIPVDELEYPYWFSLNAIPASVTTTCPQDAWAGFQVAQGAGGANLTMNQREVPDAAGNFSVPVAATPSAPGSVLLCAYTDDALTNTLAGASLILDIKPAPSSPGGGGSGPGEGGSGQPGGDSGQAGDRSRPPSPPAYARQGIRGCRALLGGVQAKRCIRGIVRRANARCRRAHSRTARARCLRSVRRVARSES